MKNQRRNSRIKTIKFTKNEFDILDGFADELVKDLIDIDYKIKEVDEKYKFYRHPAYVAVKRSLEEDSEIILNLIQKIKGVA